MTALAVSREFLSALETQLGRYGHQLSAFDLSLPTLADAPRPVLIAIQAFLNGKESPYVRQQRMTAECEHAVETVWDRLAGRDQQKFQRLLATAQQAAAVRENALFEVGLAWTPLHRCALELGRRLARAHVIAQAGDVFWLHLAEIHTALSATAVACLSELAALGYKAGPFPNQCLPAALPAAAAGVQLRGWASKR
jgi:rifampicin phosphotransferase